jgi:hypothetical protein
MIVIGKVITQDTWKMLYVTGKIIKKLMIMSEVVCNRCNTPVETNNGVTPGYFGWCPHHDEDLYKFECKVEVWNDQD